MGKEKIDGRININNIILINFESRRINEILKTRGNKGKYIKRVILTCCTLLAHAGTICFAHITFPHESRSYFSSSFLSFFFFFKLLTVLVK